MRKCITWTWLHIVCDMLACLKSSSCDCILCRQPAAWWNSRVLVIRLLTACCLHSFCNLIEFQICFVFTLVSSMYLSLCSHAHWSFFPFLFSSPSCSVAETLRSYCSLELPCSVFPSLTALLRYPCSIFLDFYSNLDFFFRSFIYFFIESFIDFKAWWQ